MIALLLALGIGAAEPSLQEVLARAAAYVESFQRQLSGLVGEETYIQEANRFNNTRGCPQGTVAPADQAAANCGPQLTNAMRTELRSHLLLVRNGRSGYLQYRDVFEVDGQTVGDRAERFTRLFSDRSASADAQKRRILEESARFNIGDVYREMNVPLLALQFLSTDNQWRFRFKRTKDAAVRIENTTETPGTFRVSTDVWVVEYQESEPRTIIRTIKGRDVKTRGRLWIEADTGRVMMTELLASAEGLDTSVNVSFKSEPLFGLLVPVEMREHYRAKQGAVIDAIATYGKFEPFAVK